MKHSKSSSFRGRTFVVLLLCLGLPLLATLYIVQFINRDVFYEQKGDNLTSLARVLDARLDEGGYDAILKNAGAENATREQKIATLNAALRDATDEAASVSEGLGVGFYSVDLDAILTYGPSDAFGENVGKSIAPDHPGRRVMATGTPMVQMGTMVRGNIMNAMIPVERGARVIGYIWANELVSDLEETLNRFTRTISVLLLFTYLLMVAIVSIFFRLLMRTEKKSRDILVLAREEALAGTRAKSAFLASMSHEMRTPMNAIIGMTSIGKSATDIARKDYAFGKIGDASRHLLGVINDVLDISKIESGKLELSPTEFAFRDMLRRVESVMDERFAEKNISFLVRIDESIPATLVCDDQRLAQVITNLLSNAVKFTPPQGSVTLFARLVEDEEGVSDKKDCIIQIDVSDTGIGLSAEQQERVFKSFEQAESSTTRKYGGTGLGLSISKNLVEMMGGRIWVQSEEGQGATFSFTVRAPAGRSQETAVPDDTDREEATNDYRGRVILLAEDVEVNREIVLGLLEDTGITVDCAHDGAEAVRMFSEAPDRYEMIFMDVQMPEMDGIEATLRIRALEVAAKRAHKIPIVAMTANVFREDIEACRAAGMDDHVGKPLDLEDVLGKLKRYLS